MLNEEIIRELERDIEVNADKYQDILKKEDEIIKGMMKKENISTKEKVLENEEFRKLLNAVRVKQAYKMKIEEKERKGEYD